MCPPKDEPIYFQERLKKGSESTAKGNCVVKGHNTMIWPDFKPTPLNLESSMLTVRQMRFPLLSLQKHLRFVRALTCTVLLTYMLNMQTNFIRLDVR